MSLQLEAYPMVGQALQALARKWWPKHVAQEASAGWLVQGAGAGSSSTMWYRFYDLDKDTGFFRGRLLTDSPPGTGKQYDIMLIEPERRHGYQWGGAYGTALFGYTDKVGY